VIESGSVSTVKSSGQTISGPKRSTTVTTAVEEAMFPLASDTNMVTVTGFPISAQVKQLISMAVTVISQLSNAEEVPGAISTNTAEPSELVNNSVQFDGSNCPVNPGIKLLTVVVEGPNKPSTDNDLKPNS